MCGKINAPNILCVVIKKKIFKKIQSLQLNDLSHNNDVFAV